jgi:mRNA interferase RelE/StbE
MEVIYLPKARHQLLSLPQNIAGRIEKKMLWYAAQKDPFSFAQPLKDPTLGTYRFRVGDYRIFCDVSKEAIAILLVLSVKHRSKAYEG